MCVWGGPLGSTVWWLSHRSRARAPLLRTTLWDLSVAASLYFSLSHVRGCTRVPLKPSSRATRLWHQSVGRSPWSFRRPCVRILVLIQLWWVLNLFLRQSRDRSFNGVKPLNWLLALDHPGHWSSCCIAFGGRIWRRMGRHLRPGVLTTFKVKIHAKGPRACSILCPFLGDHAHTYPLISSLACLPLKVIQSFWLSCCFLPLPKLP